MQPVSDTQRVWSCIHGFAYDNVEGESQRIAGAHEADTCIMAAGRQTLVSQQTAAVEKRLNMAPLPDPEFIMPRTRRATPSEASEEPLGSRERSLERVVRCNADCCHTLLCLVS